MALHSSRLLKTSTTHKWNVAQSMDDLWAFTSETFIQWSWTPLCGIAQQAIIKTLNNTITGKLTICTTDGCTLDFGSSDDSDLHAVLTVNSPAFWIRVAMFKDLGFAEAFMFGEVDCDDLSALLKILIANRQNLKGLDHFWANILSKTQRLTTYRFLGDLKTSRANISAHYDLGNILFAAFLSKDMNYSSAIFKDFHEDCEKDAQDLESLEAAQRRKMEILLARLNIQAGDRVLEIGTGWGSLAILAATTVDCQIDTITLSAEQCSLARERIQAAGLSHRITVHCMDFRESRLQSGWSGAFDRFISVEMIENVGKDFIAEYWEVVDWALKPSTGVGVVQVITMPEARGVQYDQGADFIQKWIFPGCYIPSLSFLVETMNRGSCGRLTADSVFNIGPHYARTLREWKRRFLRNWDTIIAPELEANHHLDPLDLDIFKRKWTYYFDYCEAGFSTRTLGDHIITFTRDGNVGFGCALRVES